jgi:3-phenylpropionate/cinnamic acid dioxygenase small subunit
MAGAMSAEDRLAVMNLIARYAQCLDAGDIDGYVANFTPEARIEWANGSAKGRDEIRAWVSGLMRGGIGATPARVRHVAGMPEIDGDSERCSARTYVIILSTRDDGTVVVSSLGSYADTIVKTEAGWLFEKRVMNADLGIFGRTS